VDRIIDHLKLTFAGGAVSFVSVVLGRWRLNL
jgi:hypothetical protein